MKKEKGVQKGVMEGGERNVEEGFERRQAGARKKKKKKNGGGGSEEGRTHGKASALTARVMGFLVRTRWLNSQVFWCTMVVQDKVAAKSMCACGSYS